MEDKPVQALRRKKDSSMARAIELIKNNEAGAIVSCGNVSQYLELPPMPVVLGELEALARDGLSGGWEGCVREDGSLVMENNAMFCADGICGTSLKTCREF